MDIVTTAAIVLLLLACVGFDLVAMSKKAPPSRPMWLPGDYVVRGDQYVEVK